MVCICKGTKRKPDKDCTVCIEGKFTQTRNRDPTDKANTPLELVNTDLAGPVNNESINGFKYMHSFTDVCTGAVFVYFLKAKSDAVQATEKYLADVAPYGTVKCIRSDNGTEFTSKEFLRHYRERTRSDMRRLVLIPHINTGQLKEKGTLFFKWPDVCLLTVIYLKTFGTMPFRKQPIPETDVLISTQALRHIQH